MELLSLYSLLMSPPTDAEKWYHSKTGYIVRGGYRISSDSQPATPEEVKEVRALLTAYHRDMPEQESALAHKRAFTSWAVAMQTRDWPEPPAGGANWVC